MKNSEIYKKSHSALLYLNAARFPTPVDKINDNYEVVEIPPFLTRNQLAQKLNITEHELSFVLFNLMVAKCIEIDGDNIKIHEQFGVNHFTELTFLKQSEQSEKDEDEKEIRKLTIRLYSAQKKAIKSNKKLTISNTIIAILTSIFIAIQACNSCQHPAKSEKKSEQQSIPTSNNKEEKVSPRPLN